MLLVCAAASFQGSLQSGETYADIQERIGMPYYTEYSTTWDGDYLRRFPHWAAWRFADPGDMRETVEVQLEFEVNGGTERLCSFTDKDLGFVLVFRKCGDYLLINPAHMQRSSGLSWLGEIKRNSSGMWFVNCRKDSESSWYNLNAVFDNYLSSRRYPQSASHGVRDTGKYRIVVYAGDQKLGQKVLDVLQAAGLANSQSRVAEGPNAQPNIKCGGASKEDIAAIRKMVGRCYDREVAVKRTFSPEDNSVLINLP